MYLVDQSLGAQQVFSSHHHVEVVKEEQVEEEAYFAGQID